MKSSELYGVYAYVQCVDMLRADSSYKRPVMRHAYSYICRSGVIQMTQCIITLLFQLQATSMCEGDLRPDAARRIHARSMR